MERVRVGFRNAWTTRHTTMHKCDACNKTCPCRDTLAAHKTRQPLCGEWKEVYPGIADHVGQNVDQKVDGGIETTIEFSEFTATSSGTRS